MKTILFLMSCLLLISGSQAQTCRTISFQMGVPNLTNKSFFIDNPKVNYLKLRFKNKDIKTVAVYYSRDKDLEDEFYDLEFAGDKYLFNRKYGTIDLPTYPALNLIYPTETKQECSLTIDLSPDSMKYCIDVFATTGQEIPMGSIGLVRYSKGDKQLEENLKKKLKNLGNEAEIPIDTALLFRGTVYENGEIGDVHLLSGRSSSLTSFVIRELEMLKGSWQPALQGGRPVKSFIDIFVCFNEQDVFSVTTSGLNRR